MKYLCLLFVGSVFTSAIYDHFFGHSKVDSLGVRRWSLKKNKTTSVPPLGIAQRVVRYHEKYYLKDKYVIYSWVLGFGVVGVFYFLINRFLDNIFLFLEVDKWSKLLVF